MKIHSIGAMLLHAGGWADRQTDTHHKANSRYSKYKDKLIFLFVSSFERNVLIIQLPVG